MGLLRLGAVVHAVAAMACGLLPMGRAWSLDDRVIAAVVTSVIDGDTIKVQLSDGPAQVRLANIDAPEPIQSGGGAAARALHARVLGQDVSLHVVARDSDGDSAPVTSRSDTTANRNVFIG